MPRSSVSQTVQDGTRNALGHAWQYTPPRGPAVDFTLHYNQRVERVGQTPTSGNLGPFWSPGWLAYVTDDG